MVNINKLKGAIVEKDTTQEALAAEMGIDRSTFYRKIKAGGNFTIGEAKQIVDLLGLTTDEAVSIFFAK